MHSSALTESALLQNSEYLSSRIKHYCSQWLHLFLRRTSGRRMGFHSMDSSSIQVHLLQVLVPLSHRCCPGLKPLRKCSMVKQPGVQIARIWQGRLVPLSHMQVSHVTHFNGKLNFPCSDRFIAADPQLSRNRANVLKVRRHFWQHAVTPSSANGSISENCLCVADNYYFSRQPQLSPCGQGMSPRGTELTCQVTPHFISEKDGMLCLKTTDHITPIS